MDERSAQVARHYASGGLRERIEAALAEAGLAEAALTIDDLAPVDEFHSRGRHATRDLAELADPLDSDHVLDVGCGIGGPARYLAERYGCEVTGIDLTSEFCAVGNWLCERTGLADCVRLQHGSGTELPFEDASFDVGWTIQMQMNVEDKARLYAEIHRVLRPGGRFVMQELCAGPNGPCRYPTPWATEPEQSFLQPPDALVAAVESAGFELTEWRDTTEDALVWYARQNEQRAQPDASPLGIHLVMGARADEKRANVEHNYMHGRLLQVMGAFEKS